MINSVDQLEIYVITCRQLRQNPILWINIEYIEYGNNKRLEVPLKDLVCLKTIISYNRDRKIDQFDINLVQSSYYMRRFVCLTNFPLLYNSWFLYILIHKHTSNRYNSISGLSGVGKIELLLKAGLFRDEVNDKKIPYSVCIKTSETIYWKIIYWGGDDWKFFKKSILILLFCLIDAMNFIDYVEGNSLPVKDVFLEICGFPVSKVSWT